MANEEDNDRVYAGQIITASVLPMVLRSAIDMGILDIIAKSGPASQLSPSQIASQLPILNNPHAPLVLDRILRLLASHSILTCTLSDHHGRLYGLAPVSKYFVPDQDGNSFAPMLQFVQSKVMMESWYHLKDAVEEGGIPFNRVYGMNVLDYCKTDERLFETFKASAKQYNPIFINRVLEIYDGFEGTTSLVDVGGGDGFILNSIISKYPTIKAINFDLPSVVENAPSYSGIENVAGDMFVKIPKGDTIFMKWILHSWDDKQCVQILKNCYEALPNDGKVIAVDVLIPEAPETSRAVQSLFQFDLLSFNMNPGGKERTEREFQSLAKEAGFSRVRVACRAYHFSVVEFYKNMYDYVG